MQNRTKSKILKGNSSQFFVAGELARRDVVAAITLGNCPNTDILCSNMNGTKFVHIQVKTFRLGKGKCPVGRKAEKHYGNNFFWVLAGIPDPDTNEEFSYYIIPSKIMAKNVKANYELWVNTPGVKGRPHDPKNKFRSVPIPSHRGINNRILIPMKYENNWDLITSKLK